MFATKLPALVAVLILATPATADEAFPAHRVVGNVYYVGSKDLASYLITTPEGHILINSGFEKTVPMIQAAVESLGFKMRDIKVLLASHAALGPRCRPRARERAYWSEGLRHARR